MDIRGDRKGTVRHMSCIMDRQTFQEKGQMSDHQQAIFVLYTEHPQ